LLRVWRLPSDPDRSARSYGADIRGLLERGFPGRGAALLVFGTVVPAMARVFRNAASRSLGIPALEITSRSPMGLGVPADIRRGVGVDRLLNALAAFRLYGGPAVVADFGTATTIDCVSREGEFLGGAILPGAKTASRALARFTAQLPEVALSRPRRAIGRDTASCIRTGLYFGHAGMVDRVLRETLAQMRSEGRGRVRLLATGGLAGLFRKELSSPVRWVPDLTLQGLRLAQETVRGSCGQPCG